MTAFSQHPPADHLVVHLSDTHLLGSGRQLFDRIDSVTPIRSLMERLVASELPIDALVFTGDLADRAEADAYLRLRDLVEPWATQLGAELVWVMGNHDEREPFTEILWREEPTMEPRDRVVMLGPRSALLRADVALSRLRLGNPDWIATEEAVEAVAAAGGTLKVADPLPVFGKSVRKVPLA